MWRVIYNYLGSLCFKDVGTEELTNWMLSPEGVQIVKAERM